MNTRPGFYRIDTTVERCQMPAPTYRVHPAVFGPYRRPSLLRLFWAWLIAKECVL